MEIEAAPYTVEVIPYRFEVQTIKVEAAPYMVHAIPYTEQVIRVSEYAIPAAVCVIPAVFRGGPVQVWKMGIDTRSKMG